MRECVLLPIRDSHVELVINKSREKELIKIMNRMCMNPECKKYYRHSNNILLRLYGKFKENPLWFLYA